MKISQVMDRTGLSKRCIHHYIEEGLVSPSADPRNGYKLFTEGDLTRLHIIKHLRDLNFSLSSIRSILEHPNTVQYHLYLQRKREEQEAALHRRRMDEISQCIKSMPMGITTEQIVRTLSTLPAPAAQPEGPDSIGPEDAQLILIFMWGMFILDVPMTEYRQFLWNKLAGKLELPENRYLLPVKKYFYSRPIEHVEAQFARRNRLIDRIARMDSPGREAYVEEMKRQIDENLDDGALIRKWRALYFQFIRPTALCADSTARELLMELCPRFADYRKNINHCCERVYAYLTREEGAALLEKIHRVLPGCMDIESSHSGELAALASFRETV